MAASDYNTIVVSPEPRGRFIDAIIVGTPSPGTVLQLDLAVEPVNGNYSYEVHNVATAGDRPIGPIAVLLEDNLQGKTITDAYVTGTLGRLYFPLPGDELLMLRADTAGAGSAIGDQYIVQDTTGLILNTTGSVEVEPFVGLETYADPSATTMTHVMFAGY